eukprot:Protomagalhaensia_sp_Gyna_25__2955@NODE_2738_length_918_cov_1788_308305_g141_i3_p1_GENE_NODE_2738_length_918_cov_1788_308305_g141_i3NODE_2738_length_918_cov_1788_308305_g141_i3_p1_ORF_typecomplete_len262_score58_20Ribosomal_S4e/PF00900_20/4_9e03Ribosomal_S4e/PF00900_20/6_7e28Ribosomal_S4e/PF00900_20/70RS4NT/PF08071_12/2_5e1840S_S4_C/PF16121_5/2e0240S_S4_C/PF16121_5/1e13S4/PF01479_25/3e06KOW/PF00467_29/0_04KOW/PF00467_29/5_5e03S4_2/PF13275_6/0_031_NODE_2738_length_918_cov_1788_308305_g141_i371856
MTRGDKKHLKRIAAPKHWCLDKLGGVYAPKPTSGPHAIRSCIPMAVLLRNQLKYALSYNEVKAIVMQKLVKVDGKVRTDKTFPLGFMDVVSIDKTQKHYRILLNTKGRFVPHRIKQDETGYKLCRIRQIKIGKGAIPYAYLHDGRTIRFAHPAFRRNDTVKLDLETGKPVEHLKFDIGALAMVTAGHSIGRVGKVTSIEKHPGAADMIHLKDARNESFCTKVDSVFVIGTDNKCLVSLPKEKGIKKSILEVQREKYGEFHP